MAIVFGVFGLKSSTYSTAKTQFSSFSLDLQNAMRNLKLHFVTSPNFYKSPTIEGTVYNIFDGPIDEADIQLMEAKWGSDLLVILVINSEGLPPGLSLVGGNYIGEITYEPMNGLEFYSKTLKTGNAYNQPSAYYTQHVPSGWTIDFTYWNANQREMEVGLVLGANWSTAQVDTVYGYLQNTKICGRDSHRWQDIEKSNGVFAFPSGDATQGLLDIYGRISSRGNMLVLAYGNTVHGMTSNYWPYTDTQKTKFASYASWLIGQTNTNTRYYTVWNEPDAGFGNGGTAINGTEYAALLRRVYETVKPLYPNSIILGGELTWSIAWVSSVAYTWLHDFAQAGGFDCCDGFSFHVYNFWMSSPYGPSGTTAATYCDTVYSRIAGYAGRDVDCYITEYGAPTASKVDPDTPWYSYPSTTTHGTYIYNFITEMKRRSWCKGVWIYEYDNSGTDAYTEGQNYGVRYADWTEKPAWQKILDATL